MTNQKHWIPDQVRNDIERIAHKQQAEILQVNAERNGGFFDAEMEKQQNQSGKKVIDELLEKIARHGMSSLSSQEKKNLEWARKNYYPDQDETLH